jgi:hypothetical protein
MLAYSTTAALAHQAGATGRKSLCQGEQLLVLHGCASQAPQPAPPASPAMGSIPNCWVCTHRIASCREQVVTQPVQVNPHLQQQQQQQMEQQCDMTISPLDTLLHA